MPKVLFIGNYGVSLNVSIAEVELIKGLSKKGLTIEVLSDFSEISKIEFETHGIKTIDTKLPKGIDRIFIEHVKKLQIENRYDVIHCYHNRMLRNVIIAIKKEPVKLVTYLGSLSVHWHDPFVYISMLHRRVDAVICNSQFVLNHLKKQLWGKQKEKPVLIYKGYESSWFQEVPPMDLTTIGIPENAFVVSMASTFSKQKGINYFVQAAAYLPKELEVHFILMGTNTDNEIVKKWVQKSPHPERFHLLGFRTDVKSIIKASDVYIQSSMKEGFGRSLSEAVSMGIPVIITESGGFAELIIHNENGIIVPVKNAEKIAASIAYLAKNEKVRKNMGNKAKEHLLKEFNIQNTIDETYNLYKKLLS